MQNSRIGKYTLAVIKLTFYVSWTALLGSEKLSDLPIIKVTELTQLKHTRFPFPFHYLGSFNWLSPLFVPSLVFWTNFHLFKIFSFPK